MKSKIYWTGVLITRLKEEQTRFRLVNGEWMSSTVTSLYNKITVIIKAFNFPINWAEGTRKYNNQKGILTKDEYTHAPSDSDDESDEAIAYRRRLLEASTPNKSKISAEKASSTEAQPRKRLTKALAPKKKRLIGFSDEGSSCKDQPTLSKADQTITSSLKPVEEISPGTQAEPEKSVIKESTTLSGVRQEGEGSS